MRGQELQRILVHDHAVHTKVSVSGISRTSTGVRLSCYNGRLELAVRAFVRSPALEDFGSVWPGPGDAPLIDPSSCDGTCVCTNLLIGRAW